MSNSKSTEELQQEIRAIIKSPMKSKVSTADIAVGMMSSTALSEKVIQLSQLFDQELAKRVDEARIDEVRRCREAWHGTSDALFAELMNNRLATLNTQSKEEK